MIIVLGGVPLAPYALPGSQSLGDSFLPWLHSHDAFLLQNHGAIAVGKDVLSALYKMEAIEQFAKISLTARLLGGEKILGHDEVRDLERLRSNFGIVTNAHCTGDDCPVCHPRAGNQDAQLTGTQIQSLADEVARRITEKGDAGMGRRGDAGKRITEKGKERATRGQGDAPTR
jgi:L-fuculose-phosphate aldolase